MSNLSHDAEQLLREVLEIRDPILLEAVTDLRRPKRGLVDKLCGLVLDDFCATGLRGDDEPNSRGLQLEALIDELRRGVVGIE